LVGFNVLEPIGGGDGGSRTQAILLKTTT
jgi:hypothetical protein